MEATSTRRPRRMTVMRTGDRVSPLELFFDLVFVLALTQCTALMAANPTWEGLAQGLLVLGVMWWAWVGYSWLTSVVDPEEGIVRFAILAAMAAALVVSLCIPEAFGDLGLLFAGAYAVLRFSHILLFMVASRDDPALRRSTLGLAIGTAGRTVGARDRARRRGAVRVRVRGLEALARALAERHGLFVIIALGESIVAIGIGAEGGVDAGVVVAAVLGMAVAFGLWRLYFDIVALVAERRLQNAEKGKEQNEIARDSFSYLHLPMVAGIVLVALGFKKTLEHVDDPLKLVPAVALLGGVALYLLAHTAFRWRNVHRFSWQRLLAAVILAALVPVAVEIPALGTLAMVTAVLAALIAYETIAFGELRERLRTRLLEEEGAH